MLPVFVVTVSRVVGCTMTGVLVVVALVVVVLVVVALRTVPLVLLVVPFPPRANGGARGYPGHGVAVELLQLGVRLAHCALIPKDGAAARVKEAFGDDEGTTTARSEALLRVNTEKGAVPLAATRSPV